MRLSQWFVAGVFLLEVGAGIAYASQRQWKMAGVWLCVGLANFFMLLLDEAK